MNTFGSFVLREIWFFSSVLFLPLSSPPQIKNLLSIEGKFFILFISSWTSFRLNILDQGLRFKAMLTCGGERNLSYPIDRLPVSVPIFSTFLLSQFFPFSVPILLLIQQLNGEYRPSDEVEICSNPTLRAFCPYTQASEWAFCARYLVKQACQTGGPPGQIVRPAASHNDIK
jgi:hypothetical protein